MSPKGFAPRSAMFHRVHTRQGGVLPSLDSPPTCSYPRPTTAQLPCFGNVREDPCKPLDSRYGQPSTRQMSQSYPPVIYSRYACGQILLLTKLVTQFDPCIQLVFCGRMCARHVNWNQFRLIWQGDWPRLSIVITMFTKRNNPSPISRARQGINSHMSPDIFICFRLIIE